MSDFIPIKDNDTRSINLALAEISKNIKAISDVTQQTPTVTQDIIRQVLINSGLISNPPALNNEFANLPITSADVDFLPITTPNITDLAVSRGNEYYSATGITISNMTEQVIGTIVTSTSTTSDVVLLWASVIITQLMLKDPGKGAGVPYGITFRLRQTDVSGHIVAAATTAGFVTVSSYVFSPSGSPVVLLGIHLPASIDDITYVLTAQGGVASPSQNGIVNYMTIMSLAKSK